MTDSAAFQELRDRSAGYHKFAGERSGDGLAGERTQGLPVIVLVAEDAALIALTLELSLRSAGHHPLGPAAAADEALRLARETRPELALIDIILRDGGNGIMLARALRDLYRTPVLFLSGQVPQARSARDAAWGLIAKPYDPESVLGAISVVDDLLHGRRSAHVPPQLELFGDLSTLTRSDHQLFGTPPRL